LLPPLSTALRRPHVPMAAPYTAVFRPGQDQGQSQQGARAARQLGKTLLHHAPEGHAQLEAAHHARGFTPRQSERGGGSGQQSGEDRKSTRLNSSHVKISYAVVCLNKKK